MHGLAAGSPFALECALISKPVNFVLGQVHLILSDCQALGAARAAVNSCNLKNTISIDSERDVYFLLMFRCRHKAIYTEVTNLMIFLSENLFSLVDLNVNLCLIIMMSRILILFVDWDRGVSRYDCAHNKPILTILMCSNTKGQRCQIEQEDILHALCVLS